MTRGNCSFTVTASQGYDLSSRYLTLKRGSNSLIQEYSSCSASTSVLTTVHSTDAAVVTMVAVRGCRLAMSWKYDVSRERRFFAFPTYTTRPRASRNRYTPGEAGMDPGAGRYVDGSATFQPYVSGVPGLGQDRNGGPH